MQHTSQGAVLQQERIRRGLTVLHPTNGCIFPSPPYQVSLSLSDQLNLQSSFHKYLLPPILLNAPEIMSSKLPSISIDQRAEGYRHIKAILGSTEAHYWKRYCKAMSPAKKHILNFAIMSCEGTVPAPFCPPRYCLTQQPSQYGYPSRQLQSWSEK
jgi:hypothetical protein